MKNMPKVRNAATTTLAAGLRLVLSGFIALLLVSSIAWGQSGQLAPVPAEPPFGFHQDLSAQLSASGWRRVSRQCPLPPASVFGLQNHLRMYRETWPTPGSKWTEDWPEYVAEADDALD
ncbi:MAG: hypothetical protein ACLP2P_06760 [Desulfobaccales bacterium]